MDSTPLDTGRERADNQVLSIGLIRMDGGTQPRAIEDANVIADYAEQMQAGALFPPVDVFYDGTAYWLADGFHRTRAALQAGLPEIGATVYAGSLRDAILYSVGANKTHGLQRKNVDKRRAVHTLLEDDEWRQWSNREIARHCGVSHDTVNRLRKEVELDESSSSERLYNQTRNGVTYTYTMNTVPIGKPHESITIPLLAPDSPLMLRMEAGELARHEAVALQTALDTAPDAVQVEALRWGVRHADVIPVMTHCCVNTLDTWTTMVETGTYDGEHALATATEMEIKTYLERAAYEHRQQNKIAALQASDNNEWYTPARFVEAARRVMGGIDLDPASCAYANEHVVRALRYYAIDDDGLKQDWWGRVWLNPPYGRAEKGSNQGAWSARLIQAYEQGGVEQAVLLVNAVTDRSWFYPLWDYPICFVKQRIQFYNTETEAGNMTHGSVLVYFGNRRDDFACEMAAFGRIVVPDGATSRVLAA